MMGWTEQDILDRQSILDRQRRFDAPPAPPVRAKEAISRSPKGMNNTRREMIIAIDPGPTESALVVWTGERIDVMRFLPNGDILALLKSWNSGPKIVSLVIEKIASFGMPVGMETFETVFWTGRFAEAYGADRTHRITRGDVKLHLCHSMRAKDANLRQAIIDRFGGKDKAIGKKANPGPFHGVHSHTWSALAVAITWHDLNISKREVGDCDGPAICADGG